MAGKATRLEGTGDLAVYVDATGEKLRVGAQSRKSLDPREALVPMSKGERRRVRKALHRQGFARLSKASL
jgi:hypothetical protein